MSDCGEFFFQKKNTEVSHGLQNNFIRTYLQISATDCGGHDGERMVRVSGE